MKAYFEETIKGKTPTLVVFLREKETDGEAIRTVVEQLKEKYEGRANFQRVDVSDNHHIAVKHKITKYPTWVLYKEGEELMRESGDKTITALSELVERAL